MPVYAVGEKVPAIHKSAFIAPTATVVGDVRIEAGASIWYGAVVRGDTSYAVIGAGANIQDGAVVHGRANMPALIGEGGFDRAQRRHPRGHDRGAGAHRERRAGARRGSGRGRGRWWRRGRLCSLRRSSRRGCWRQARPRR